MSHIQIHNQFVFICSFLIAKKKNKKQKKTQKMKNKRQRHVMNILRCESVYEAKKMNQPIEYGTWLIDYHHHYRINSNHSK